MADDCERHAGQAAEQLRSPQDHIMRDLAANQSGAGRHKCPYCAYERGVKAGKESVVKRLADLLLTD